MTWGAPLSWAQDPKECLDHAHPPAQCVDLGWRYEQGSNPDYLVAGWLYDDACLRGDGFGCIRLGHLAMSGLDTNTARTKKANRTRKALIARAGGTPTNTLNVRQQASLELAVGMTIATAKPSITSENRTIAFQKRACELDDGELCFVLGQAQRATPTHFTTQEAKGLLSKACNLGHAPACAVTQDPCFSEPLASECPEVPPEGGIQYTERNGSQKKEGTYLHIHKSEVKLRKQTRPHISETLRAYLDKVGEPECHLYVTMNADGVPFKAEPTPQCAPELHDSAADSILEWRWTLPKALKDKNKPIRIFERVVYY